MLTELQVQGANCPICFNEALDDVSSLDGVHSVTGSIEGPCIAVEHDESAIEVITATIRNKLHGVDLYSNEIQMIPVEPVVLSGQCTHHHGAGT